MFYGQFLGVVYWTLSLIVYFIVAIAGLLKQFSNLTLSQDSSANLFII